MADDGARLAMPIGEAISTQRSIRRPRPDPVAGEDLPPILEAATKAPGGGKARPTRSLVLTDAAIIKEFGAPYREARWAKRRAEGQPWTTREEIPGSLPNRRAAARLADEIADTPCIVPAFSLRKGRRVRSSRRCRT